MWIDDFSLHRTIFCFDTSHLLRYAIWNVDAENNMMMTFMRHESTPFTLPDYLLPLALTKPTSITFIIPSASTHMNPFYVMPID